jgi:hypothetical protein
MGNYIIEKPNTEEVGAKTEFTGYDYMIKFNCTYKNRVKFPCKASVLLQDICNQAGVECGSLSFINSEYMILGNPFTNNENCKTVLSNIAQLAVGYAYIGRDNKLYIKTLKTTAHLLSVKEVHKMSVKELNMTPVYKLAGISSVAEEKVDGNNYFEFFKNNKFGKVNSLVLKISEIDGENTVENDQDSIKDDGLTEISIEDNYFLNTEEERKKVINPMWNALKGLEYLPFETTYYGYPYLDVGDPIVIADTDDKEYFSYVFNYTFEYDGSYNGTLKTEAMTKTQTAYKNSENLKSRFRRAERTINKIEGTIEDIIEQQDKNTEKLTKHEQTIDSISDKVSHIEETTNTIEGNKTIQLGNAIAGELIELHIYGNNDVFSYLTISDDVVLSDDLYLLGDSIVVVKDSKGNSKEYELGITEPLRQKDDVYDEYVLKDGKAKIIRRINIDGTIKAKETIEDLEAFSIELFDGTNTISIKNYTAILKAKFAIQNDMTNIYASKVEMTAEITTKANEINQKVEQKIDAKTITGAYLILKINDDESIAKLKADKIELSANDILNLLAGKEINLSSKKITFKSDDFSVDTNGKISATGGTIGGFDLSADKFVGKLNGLYAYDLFDARACLLAAVGIIDTSSELIEVYDLNNDGKVDSGDSLRILKMANGTYENTKVLTGTLKIDSKDPKNSIAVYKDDKLMARIGTGGVSAHTMNCKNFICGTDENIAGAAINGAEGTLILEEKSKSDNLMGDHRTVITPRKIEIEEARIGEVRVGEDRGNVMHGKTSDHMYRCHWTGSQLQFWVDTTNVGTLSDKRLKKEIKDIDDDFVKIINEVEMKQFKVANRNGLISFGILAQDLMEIFGKYNKNPFDYEIVQETLYKEGDETTYYTINYEQFLILKQRATDMQIKQLGIRLKEMEEKFNEINRLDK